jgi:hypothetical protein
MFLPLFLLVTVILTFVSASNLTQIEELNNVSNLLTSQATFYASESVLEDNLYEFKKAKKNNTLIKSFHLEKEDEGKNSGTFDNGYYLIDIVNRGLSENSKAIKNQNQGENFSEFRFIDVKEENNFDSLSFAYNYPDNFTDNGILIDIFVFPKTNLRDNKKQIIDFGNIKELSKKNGSNKRNIKRMIFHSLSSQMSVNAGEQAKTHHNFDKDKTCCNPNLGNLEKEKLGCNKNFWHCSLNVINQTSNNILISGLKPLKYNYLIRYQTINKKPINYSLQASLSGLPIKTPVSNQFLEIDSETASLNMYQRVKHQQKSFAPLKTGLDFVLFSNESINR